MTKQRPLYHPTAPTNWLSDPNGPVFWQGRWHVFYQHNPDSPRWGLMHWGHLVSDDLLHWVDEGIAMHPRLGGPDEDGCWSGCIRVIHDEPVAFYTGASGTGDAHRQVVIRAVGNDSLTAFHPAPAGAVVPAAAPSTGTSQQRDPFLLRWGDRWIMLLGTSLIGGEPGSAAGAVVAWESADTVVWTYRGVVFSTSPGGAGIEAAPVWECPQLVQIEGRWVLVVSTQLPGSPDPLCRGAVWFLGDFDGERFTAVSMGPVDGGEVYYAPAIAAAPDGRQLLWGWLQESMARRGGAGDEWSGALALPRELSVRADRLVTAPIQETTALWAPASATHGKLELAAGDIVEVVDHAGDAYRIRMTFGGAGQRLVLGDDGDGAQVALEAMPTEAGCRLTAWVGTAAVGGVDVAADRACSLEIYVDGPIVEVFVGDGGALTFRVDPTLDGRSGVRLEGLLTGCTVDFLDFSPLRVP